MGTEVLELLTSFRLKAVLREHGRLSIICARLHTHHQLE